MGNTTRWNIPRKICCPFLIVVILSLPLILFTLVVNSSLRGLSYVSDGFLVTTIGYTDDYWNAFGHNGMRSNFNSGNVSFVFYFDGEDPDNLVYKAKRFGEAFWGAENTLYAFSSGETQPHGSIYFDDSRGKVHITISANSYGKPIQYRMGQVLGNAILWVGDWQIVVSYPNEGYCYNFITVDSGGMAWIGWSSTLKRNDTVLITPHVAKNLLNDGHWATALDFNLSDTVLSQGFWWVSPKALSGNRVYVFYQGFNMSVYGRLFDDGCFGYEETITDRPISERVWGSYTATTDGDDVYLCYGADLKFPSSGLYHRDLTGWGSAVEVYMDSSFTFADESTLLLYEACGSLNRSAIFYQRYSMSSERLIDSSPRPLLTINGVLAGFPDKLWYEINPPRKIFDDKQTILWIEQRNDGYALMFGERIS